MHADEMPSPPSSPNEGARGPIWAPGYRHRTHAIASIDFEYRVRPEDFEVEELGLVEPSGVGSHCWLWIEKRELGTVEAVRHLARALERRPEDFSYAGRKDARAISRQWICVEHVDPVGLEELPLPGMRVLRALRHDRKLRLGQLRGNRFRLLLRELRKSEEGRLGAALECLRSGGLPNYFGSQRFGRRGLTHELGSLLLRGEFEAYLLALASEQHAPESAPREQLREALRGGTRGDHRRLKELAPALDPDLAAVARQLARRPLDLAWAVRAIPARSRQFHISAVQSRIFNRGLSARLAGGELLEPGDRAIEFATMNEGRGGGQPLALDISGPDLEAWRERARRLEVAASGALPGGGVRELEGRPAEVEAQALAAEGLSPEDFRRGPTRERPLGARRPLLVPLEQLRWEFVPGGCQLDFVLPRGSYATSLLEELRKDHQPGRVARD